MDEEPLNRHNQTRIAALINEVKIVLDSLRSQDMVVYSLEDNLEEMSSRRPGREI